jgi:hypothetical protein
MLLFQIHGVLRMPFNDDSGINRPGIWKTRLSRRQQFQVEYTVGQAPSFVVFTRTSNSFCCVSQRHSPMALPTEQATEFVRSRRLKTKSDRKFATQNRVPEKWLI